MKRQIVITGWQSKVLTALYEEDILCELNLEPQKSRVRVGDIYIGKVKHIVQNIQAAFVEITPGVMGYYPLKENAVHFFVNPKKNDKIVAGDEIVVQVDKENLKTKAWFLTGRLSFPGRYTVLTKGKAGIQVSSKIKDKEERSRLTEIISDRPMEGAAWMIRTEARGQSSEVIREEMDRLLVDYNRIMSTARNRTCFTKLMSGASPYAQLITKFAHGSDCRVTTDLSEIYEELKENFERWGLSSEILRYYKDDAYPLIKLKGIQAQMDRALQKRVWLKSGAYLVIEPTEALTVIDVNTGKAIGKQKMEENFFKINIEAAREVCRQLRLRNISGIVIVDFINMKEPEHLKALMDILREEAARDSIQTTVVDRTSLHLIEMTRKKVHRSLAEQVRL